ncbi:MAG: glucose-6-phosphate isomerase [Thermoanaerobaculia bacterium]
MTDLPPDRIFRLGSASEPWEQALAGFRSRKTASRIWHKDATVWKTDSAHREIIENALGWLEVAREMPSRVREIEFWCREVAGARHAVLCGMGGSSLAPEVFAKTFQRPDRPRLLVLDSTSPEQVRSVRAQIDPARTVFLIASKSGSTLETLTQERYFRQEAEAAAGSIAAASKLFVAITDPGSPLERRAAREGYSRVFRNFHDIGGRYSALSYFGLVPAALCGADISALLDRARGAMAACREPRNNPGLELGAALGVLARMGRDKLTIVCSAGIASFGTWLEQLVAESTGKEGRGIVPVEGEPLGDPGVYGNDRFFVYERLKDDSDGSVEQRLDRLSEQGQPVAAFSLDDRYAIAARMFVWEFAVAAAGSLLGIDAFDQPNVQESKDNTAAVLKDFTRRGRLPEEKTDWTEGGLEFRGARLGDFLRSARRGKDYLSLQIYGERNDESEEVAGRIRTRLRDATGCATTVGFGPRFLHSTGQLHKGGPDEGVFLQFVSPGRGDVAIPGSTYGFAIFLEAQAIGDARALLSRKRRFLKCRFSGPSAAGLRDLARAVSEACGSMK